MHSDKVEVSEPAPGCRARVQQTTEPEESESIWLFAIQPAYLRKLFMVSLLFGLCSAAYIVAECHADSSRFSYMIENQNSMVVSGDVNRQRDAVLANFATYNNRLQNRQRLAQ